jgi:hypothetical protein
MAAKFRRNCLPDPTPIRRNGLDCSRYIIGTRGKGEVNTGTNHLGFRCVKDKVDNSVSAKSQMK